MFVYCETIAKLRPKVAILENVKGIVIGNARKYAIGIMERLQEIGYDVQIFLLNQFEDHQCFFSFHKSNCSGLSNKNTLFKYSLKSV